MKDSLEDFIKDHRNEMDNYIPRPELWNDISKGIRRESRPAVVRHLWQWGWVYGAAAIVVLALGYTVSLWINNDPVSIPKAGTEAKLEQIAPEVVHMESKYGVMIAEKQRQLEHYDIGQKDLDADLDQQMHYLDSAYSQLKTELIRSRKKDDIVEAMAQNLQMHIALLNRQLQVLENVKKLQTDTKDEKINI